MASKSAKTTDLFLEEPPPEREQVGASWFMAHNIFWSETQMGMQDELNDNISLRWTLDKEKDRLILLTTLMNKALEIYQVHWVSLFP